MVIQHDRTLTMKYDKPKELEKDDIDSIYTIVWISILFCIFIVILLFSILFK